MKRLAFFTLEGLVQRGSHEVWVLLGRYESREAADAAVASAPGHITATRVMPYFRDSGLLPTATNGSPATRGARPHFKPASESVTVA